MMILVSYLWMMWLLVLSSSSITQTAATLAVLIDLYNSTAGENWSDPWPVKENGNFCQWTGVSCSRDGKSITGLNLFQRGLQGTLPRPLGNLTEMKNFNVSSNNISGTLPVELSVWSSLKCIDVGNNSISGTLPPEYASWNESLEILVLRNNTLNGTLPDKYSALNRLRILFLSFNQLTGTVPSTWMSGLSNVALFDVSSNQLSGSLPSTLPASLVAVLFDNNRFSWNLPTGWSQAKSLFLVGLQGNPFLVGPIPKDWASMFETPLSVGGGLMSLCGTAVCTPSLLPPMKLLYQAFICFRTANRDVVFNLAAIEDTEIVATFSDIIQAINQSAYLTTATICSTLSPPPPASTRNPSTQSPPSSSAVALTWSLFDAAKKSTAVVTSASSGAGLFSGGAGGGDAGDAQMLAAVLSSSCVCGFNASSASSGGASVMSFATSPFSLLADPVYVAIGNPMIALALFLVQLLLVSRRLPPINHTTTATDFEHRELGESLHTQQQQRQSASFLQRIAKMLQLKLQFTCPEHHHTYPFDHSRQRQAQQDNCCSCASIRAQYRFPNLSIAIAMFLAPGVVGAVVRTCISTPASIASASPVGLRVFGILLGVCFLFGFFFVIEFVVFREMVEKGFVRVRRGNIRSTPERLHSSGRRNRMLKSESPSSLPSTTPSHAHSGGTITREPRLRFKLYKNPASSFAPIPRTVAEYCLPNGHWLPQSERLAIGGIVGSMDPAHSSFRAWLWLFAANCITQFVASLPFDALADPTSCDAAQIILVLVAFGCAALIALRRPFRFLLMSAVNSVTLVLVGCVSILQMACRHTPEHVSQTDLSGYTTFVSIVLLLSKMYLIGAPFLEGFLATKNNVASVVQDVSRTPPPPTHLRPEFQIHGSSQGLDMRSKTPHHQQQQQLPTSPQQSSSCGDTLINQSLVSSSSLTLLPGSIAMSLSPQHATGRSVSFKGSESQAMRVEWGSMTQVEALEKLIRIVCSYD